MAGVFGLSRQSARGGARARPAVLSIRMFAVLGVMALIFLLVNWVYQVVRKPTELLFPVSRTFTKSPAQTWHEYSTVFREEATPVISAPLLAALAQVEASGNPLVQTYWRWSWLALAHPFEVYKPASSAVGMYQMTDGTFQEARHYCIRSHAAIHDTAEDEEHRCPSRSYTRLRPSDAVELTSAYLDMHVAGIAARLHAIHPSLRQKQDLAAIIHLCGAGAAESYARRGFKFSGERCGDHDPRIYLARVNAMKGVFARMAAAEGIKEPAASPPAHVPPRLSASAAAHSSLKAKARAAAQAPRSALHPAVEAPSHSVHPANEKAPVQPPLQ